MFGHSLSQLLYVTEDGNKYGSMFNTIMLCQVSLRCLVLRMSVPSLTLSCSVHLTIKDLNLNTMVHSWPISALVGMSQSDNVSEHVP